MWHQRLEALWKRRLQGGFAQRESICLKTRGKTKTEQDYKEKAWEAAEQYTDSFTTCERQYVDKKGPASCEGCLTTSFTRVLFGEKFLFPHCLQRKAFWILPGLAIGSGKHAVNWPSGVKFSELAKVGTPSCTWQLERQQHTWGCTLSAGCGVSLLKGQKENPKHSWSLFSTLAILRLFNISSLEGWVWFAFFLSKKMVFVQPEIFFLLCLKKGV